MKRIKSANQKQGRQSPPVTKAERLHQPGCSPPLHATDHLGLVGARTARHDREPGGPQLCSGPLVKVRVSLAEEKGHQVTALLAELIAESSFNYKRCASEAYHTR